MVGVAIGSVASMALHLLFWDSKFLPSFHDNWIHAQRRFDGPSAYERELFALACVPVAALMWFLAARVPRYVRAWWAGIASLTTIMSAVASVVLLRSTAISFWDASIAVAVILFVMTAELTLQKRSQHRSRMNSTDILNIPRYVDASARALSVRPSGKHDEPIEDWSEDLIGRSAVVEMLAKYALQGTPVIALQGALGDGKTSVLNLLTRTLDGRAIVVSFSTWLPGDEASLVTDLFRDIATECRKYIYVPQLRKHALAYARTMSGSVSYLAGLKELLPMESQKQEINDLNQSLARVPLPIVVLLDELDRMNKEELKMLLKMLRGASAISNTAFVCAFSDAEIRRKLLGNSAEGELTQEYLEKFFTVTVRLPVPDGAMIGRLFKTRVMNRFTRERSWFSGIAETQKFENLLDQLWDECISRLCTNLRKETLLSNDISSAATLLEREVDPLDLAAIECFRRFYPRAYDLIRQKPTFLVYEGGSWKDRLRNDEEKEESSKFFQELNTQINAYPEPEAAKRLLSYMFPKYHSKNNLLLSYLRQSTRDAAWVEKRICDPEYFAIYFRAGLPEALFSNLELERVLSALDSANSEDEATAVISRLLKENPKDQARRDDALLKLSRSVSKLTDNAAKQLALAIAAHAMEYSYGELNLGEAARALNIVFEVAQRLARGSEVQLVLRQSILTASDDTFALRLLEYTEKPDRNKILTNFKNVDVDDLQANFMQRMRSRYGPGVPVRGNMILQGDWRAFQRWVKNSAGDATIEQDFWRRYIGQSRKRFAQATNFLYPSGYTWSEDPRPIINELFPINELGQLEKNLPNEELDETEEKGIVRLRELLQGVWYDMTRRISADQGA